MNMEVREDTVSLDFILQAIRLLKSSIGVTWELHCEEVSGECREQTWDGSRKKEGL